MTDSTRSSASTSVVEGDDRGRVVGVCRASSTRPRAQHVVHRDHAAGPHPGHQLVPVGRVAGLVGVDEGQVEVRLGRQRGQRLGGRADAQLDPVGHAGPCPVARGRSPVYSSEMSQQISRPPSASPRAMASDDRPVKVPTSTACRAPSSRVRKVRNGACSGAICMVAWSGSAARVSATRSRDERVGRGAVRDDIRVQFVAEADRS